MAPILTMTTEFVGRKTDDDNWESDHWTVVLHLGHHTMTTTFHMGTGLNGETPTLVNVLSSLTLDRNAFTDCADVLDYATEFGADLETLADRKRVRLQWETLERQSRQMENFFGDYLDQVCETDWENDWGDETTEVNLAEI